VIKKETTWKTSINYIATTRDDLHVESLKVNR